MRIRVLATSLLLLVPLAAACSDDSGSTDGGPKETGAGGAVAESLAQVPATDGASDYVVYGDLERASELAGVDRPDSTDPDALIGWLGPITGLGDGSAQVFVPIADGLQPQQAARAAEFEEELGFSLLDVDSFVESGTPPRVLTVVSGDLGQDTLADDLVDLGDGVVSAGEGEDMQQDLEGRTTARPLGVPLRLSAKDGRIAMSGSTDLVSSWRADEGKTLADDPTLAGMADLLDERGAYSAVLTQDPDGYAFGAGGGRMSPEQLEQLREQVGGDLIADEFDAVAIGWSTEGDAARIHVVHHFDSAEAAARAADSHESRVTEGASTATRQPLSQLVTFEEASSAGEYAVLTLGLAEGGRPDIALRMLQQRDLLFTHS